MAGKPIIVEGQTATNPTTGEKIVYRGGKWFPSTTSGAAADTPSTPLTPASDSRTRVVVGLGPAVEAQRHMYQAEGWNGGGTYQPGGDPQAKQGHNPLTDHPILNAMAHSSDPEHRLNVLGRKMDLSELGNQLAPQDFQNYMQAAKTWEAAILPVLSGAAVTPSEAERQIKANLPVYGDKPETLARKATNRAMMTNAAADLAGKPRPFPQVGTFRFDTAPASAPAPAGGARERTYNPKTGRLE